jgi:type VI secretion system secreted protein VgrG
MIILVFSLDIFSDECISGKCTNGVGTYLYSNGTKYVGSFKNGKLHGKGTLFFANENDPDAQTLLGKAETGLKNAVSSAKNALGQSFTSPSSVLKTLETAKQLKEGGAKALLPMLQQGVESQLIDQVTGLTSKGFSNTQQTGQAVINGLKNTISEQPINPLRQYIRAKDTETDQNRKLDTMNMTFK